MTAKKKKALPNSLIVTQSNKLVESRYNLPLGEQRLILTMIARIQPDDEDFKPYRIRVHEFAEFMGIDKNHVYVECKKTTEKLLTRVISIEEPDGLLQIGWLSSAKYIDGTGMVNLTFDPLLKPYLLQLKSNFTSCKLAMLLSFKSQYTMRIYTLLKQYEKLKTREIEIDVLRDMLGIGKEQYSDFCDFRKRILLPTQKELAEKADLYFEFEEIKYGRRVGAILFHIFSKKLPAALLGNDESPPVDNISNKPPAFIKVNLPAIPVIDNLLLLVPEQYRNLKGILDAIIKYEKKQGFEYVRRNILYSNAKSDSEYMGYLVGALENDWSHDWHEKQQKPVKPRFREVWERQGFKSENDYANFMLQKTIEKLKN
jgi:Initiator Replication protein